MFDSIQLFKDHKIKYWTSGRNVAFGWVNTACPFCGDTSNHLGWPPNTGKYTTCWKCGVHPVRSAIKAILKIQSWDQVNDIIWEYTGAGTKTQISSKEAKALSLTPPGEPLTRFHKDYLKKRGFDPDELVRFYHIKGTGPGEKWNNIDYGLRVIIPIIFNGEVVSFQGRDISGRAELRYKGCQIEQSVINYKHILYNWDNIRFKKAVVVEGIVDVWKMGQGFVASFGTTMTPSQINLLTEMDEIVFLFDNEVSAQDKATEYASQLAVLGKQVSVVDADMGKDPGEYTEKEIKEVKQFLGVL